MERGCVSSEWSDATEVCLSDGNKYTSKWGGTEGKRPDYLVHTKQAWHGESEANKGGGVM